MSNPKDWSEDEIEIQAGPAKGTVRGPVAIIVVVLLVCSGGIAWKVDQVESAFIRAQAASDKEAKKQHDALLAGQLAIVQANEESDCMIALPVPSRPSAVAYKRAGFSVCDYVMSVYLAGKP